MKIKPDNEERVAIFIGRRYRELLNEVANRNHRGQRDQVELLIEQANQQHEQEQ